MKKTLSRAIRFRICLKAWQSWFHHCTYCGKIILPFQSKFRHFVYSNGKHGYAHWKCSCEMMYVERKKTICSLCKSRIPDNRAAAASSSICRYIFICHRPRCILIRLLAAITEAIKEKENAN